MTTKRLLGWLGPIIVIVGAAIAGLGVWYVLSARPVAGDVIDTIVIGADAKVVVRAEKGGNNNSFIELHERGKLVWQAYIPKYAGAPGRPAIAWSDRAVTVRVERGGRAEVFAFARGKGHKLGMLRLAQVKEPIRMHAQGPITLTDHVRSFEIVTGADWGYLIAIDLTSGEGVWQVELGKAPIGNAGVDAGRVWIEQLGKQRFFDPKTGRELAAN